MRQIHNFNGTLVICILSISYRRENGLLSPIPEKELKKMGEGAVRP